ncbi:MAG TPA: hypothetical protein VGX23_33980 [Actinocrinis sp.]|nr:hypothetical protein [Actinocrinis sp.]
MVVETFHRIILSYDVQGSTGLDTATKILARRLLRDGLRTALKAASIPDEASAFLDTGDGAIVLIDATVSKQRVLGPCLTAFHDELQRSYERSTERFQTRLSVHAGDVHSGPDGYVGADLDHVCRLVEAPILKRTMEATPSASLGVIVSDVVYQQAVWRADPVVFPADYAPVVATVKETTASAWVRIPGWKRPPLVSAARDGAGPDVPAPAPPDAHHPAGVAVNGSVGVLGTATINGPFTMNGPAGGAR